MHYDERSRRAGILAGFALGIAAGAGAALLLGGRRTVPGSAAVARARGLRAPTGRRLHASGRGGAAARMARKRFRL
jgi:hypothetical protein